MSETTNVRLVRCPKCGKVLRERHGFTIYRCGGCETLLRAKEETMPSIYSDLASKKSFDDEVSPGCAIRNEKDCDVRDNIILEEKMANMKLKSRRTIGKGYVRDGGFSKSPARSRNGDVSEDVLSESSGVSQSPARSRNGDASEGVLSEFSGVSKSPVRSRNGGRGADGGGTSDRGGLGRSQVGSVEERAGNMRERAVGDTRGVSRSPARSFHGGRSESPEYDSNAGEKIGSWVNRIGRQQEMTARSISPKASFSDWVGGGISDRGGVGRSQVGSVEERAGNMRERAVGDTRGVSRSPARSFHGGRSESPEYDSNAGEKIGSWVNRIGRLQEMTARSISPKASFSDWVGGGVSDRGGVGRSQVGSVEERAGNMRERAVGDTRGVSRSPARSFHGGRSESPEYDSNAGEKIGSWVNRIGRQQEMTARSISPKASFSDWVGGGISDRGGVGRSQVGSVEERAGNMRERAVGDTRGVSRSPARSFHGGRSESPEYDSNAGEKIGSWVNRIGRQQEMAARSISPKASFSDWVGAERAKDGNEFKGSPLRRWRESSDEGLNRMDSEFHRMQRSARADQVSMEAQCRLADKYGRPMDASGKDWVHGTDHVPGSTSKFTVRSKEQFMRSYGTLERCGDEGSGVGAFHGDPRVARDYRMISSYADEGPSDLHPDSLYGYRSPTHSFHQEVHPEQERAQLLRRYCEIKDQLSRRGDASGEKWYSSTSHFSGSDECVENEPLGKKFGSPLHFSCKSPRRPPYANHGSRPIPHEYDDPYLPQLGITHHLHSHFQPESVHVYTRLQYTGVHPEPCEFDHQHKFFHHRTCCCSHCYFENKQAHHPPTHYTAVSCDSRVPNHDNDVNRSDEHVYDASGFTHHCQKRILVSDLNRLLCHPFAGGAPFILCYNCLGILKLPPKLKRMKKNRFRLQCRACSARMAINLENKMAIVPIVLENQPIPMVVKKNSHDSAPKVKSYDSDANGSSFQPIDYQSNIPSEGQRRNSNGAEKRERLSPDSFHSSRDVSKLETNLVSSVMANSDDMPVKNDYSFDSFCTPSGSPEQEHFDFSFASWKPKSAKNMNCTEQAKEVDERDGFNQISVEAAEIATEIEVDPIEFPNNSLAEDLAEISGDFQVGTTSSQSSRSHATFITSFRHIDGLHDSDVKHDVFVNGRHISPCELSRAENQAGRISPGSYWYDSRAGFWGVMGHHCLGIIPPFIEEFSFPMPVDCSGGGTAISVNGRELHPSDLELLARRGLPTTRDKSYVIQISGEVIDEDTGTLVTELGRLAPTVEKEKRGFGMLVPETLED